MILWTMGCFVKIERHKHKTARHGFAVVSPGMWICLEMIDNHSFRMVQHQKMIVISLYIIYIYSKLQKDKTAKTWHQLSMQEFL